MRTEFYVTTTEIDHPEHEHVYRLPQGDTIPEDQTLKTQRPAGLFKLRELARFPLPQRNKR